MQRDWNVLGLETFEWPVTWRWHMRAPWGDTTQEFTVDAPGVAGSLDASMKLGLELWHLAIAAAITNQVELVTHDTVAWRLAPAAVPMTHVFTAGHSFGTPSPREHTPVIVMHTGHLDSLAVRRLYFPGVPAKWTTNGLMIRSWMTVMEAHAQSVFMGLARELTGAPMRWLLRYPDLLPSTSSNPSGVSFRLVEYLRVTWHTDRAPLPSSEAWP